MRLQDFCTFVPTKGPITLKNKKFKGWKVILNSDVEYEYYFKNERIDNFEDEDSSYRLFCAMRQDDCWEEVEVQDGVQS